MNILVEMMFYCQQLVLGPWACHFSPLSCIAFIEFFLNTITCNACQCGNTLINYDWSDVTVVGKDATEEFEDAGHSKSARELMEKFHIGEIDQSSQAIPRLQIFSKTDAFALPKKIGELTKQYWVVPVAVVGLSLVVGYLYLRKKW